MERLASSGDIYAIPGCAFRISGYYHSAPLAPVQDLDGQVLPAYDLLDWRPYAESQITPAILTKRGCAFFCSYCPYNKLEGKHYRITSPQRVIAEANHTKGAHTAARLCSAITISMPHASMPKPFAKR